MSEVGEPRTAVVGGLFRRRIAMLWVALWLVFLISPLEVIWEQPPGAGKALAVAALVLFGVVYVLLFAVSVESRRAALPSTPSARWWAWAGLGAMVGIAAPVVPAAGSSSLVLVVYLAAASVFSLPPRLGIALVVLLAAGTEVAARTVPGWSGERWGMSLTVLFAGAAVWGIRQAAQRQSQLVRTKERMAELAVQEERSRISRDLHDILGHSLTVITVKAELAGRLVEHGSDRAGSEIADIERLARDALADVRAAIDAQHRVTLPGELSSARAALTAAGIDAEIPGAADDVPTRYREVFAWAVREGVTNVVRHSGARRCVVTLTAASVQVDDDGAGPGTAPSSAPGHGLSGLRQRAEGAGARVWTGRSRLGGFRLEVVAALEPGGPASGRRSGRVPDVAATPGAAARPDAVPGVDR